MSEVRPKIHVFYCINSYETSDIAKSKAKDLADLNLISMPCSGKLDILYLTKAFETGADAVAVMMCKNGDCKYVEGNLRTAKRVEAVGCLMAEAGLGKGLVSVILMNGDGLQGALNKLSEFCSSVGAQLNK
jgi:coenzyme F420-reducing hydrogenase delta subunit